MRECSKSALSLESYHDKCYSHTLREVRHYCSEFTIWTYFVRYTLKPGINWKKCSGQQWNQLNKCNEHPYNADLWIIFLHSIMFDISFKAINFPFLSERSGIVILESTERAGRACWRDTSSCNLCLRPAGAHKAIPAEQNITASAESSWGQMWRAEMKYVNMTRAVNRVCLLFLHPLSETLHGSL